MTTPTQLQAYWKQSVAFAPSEMVGGEIYTCHDLADLYAMQKALAGKAGVLVRRIERDGDDIASWPVDLAEFIREQEAERRFDTRAYHREQARAAL